MLPQALFVSHICVFSVFIVFYCVLWWPMLFNCVRVCFYCGVDLIQTRARNSFAVELHNKPFAAPKEILEFHPIILPYIIQIVTKILGWVISFEC